MRKKIKKEELVQLVYDKKYLHYDNAGLVVGISIDPSRTFKNFQIELELIPNFISGKKNFINYKIDYFLNIAEGLISDEDDIEDVLKNQVVLYEIPVEENNNTFDIVVKHDSLSKKWIVETTADANKLSAITTIPLYVTVKNNYNFLVSSYQINPLLLVDNAIELNFLVDEESNLNNISVLTVKKFKKYGLVKV